RKNHKREFRTPQLSDRSAYEAWSREGLDTNQRAHRQWQEVLANYVPPALDESIDQKLLEFMNKRNGK
ncbi:MAG: trimethylamine:corrinoid methyltransferase, partial [Firmicutes bacterium]|nr:trimethylamine:corrinoid methyltransferase [Bacillota bacterium]